MTDAPWEAEHEVTAEAARALIAAQFPELRPDSVRVLGVGWDNSAFVVNEEFVFRFPRRQVGAELLEHEVRILPRLAGRLPVMVPVPVYVGSPAGDYPWGFAGYRRLPGRTACTLDLSDEQRTALARPLGEFLNAMHALDVNDPVLATAPPDTLGRLDPQRLIPRIERGLNELKEERVITSGSSYERILSEAAEATPGNDASLVHGDLYARHLLVDDAGGLTGVIDWGDVHRGDPAVDLAMVHTFLPPGARAKLEDAYGRIEDAQRALARLRGLAHTISVASYALKIGDSDLLRESARALAYLRD